MASRQTSTRASCPQKIGSNEQSEGSSQRTCERVSSKAFSASFSNDFCIGTKNTFLALNIFLILFCLSVCLSLLLFLSRGNREVLYRLANVFFEVEACSGFARNVLHVFKVWTSNVKGLWQIELTTNGGWQGQTLRGSTLLSSSPFPYIFTAPAPLLLPPAFCTWCALSCIKKCGRCGLLRYCSKACQIAHWPHHKRGCTANRLKPRPPAPAPAPGRAPSCFSLSFAPTSPSSASVQPKLVCGYCENPAIRVCSRCCLVRYCSVKCQRTHWPAHKKVCRKDTVD